jgi:hypothetical protein
MHGGRLSADSVQSLLAKYVKVAAENCASLKSKRVSPHVLRHYLPNLTMSGSFDRNGKHLKNKGNFRIKLPGTRHSLFDLQAVQEPQQMVAGLETG